MRILKWIVGIAAGLVLLVVLFVLIVTMVIDPIRFKGRIEAAVHDATGRPLRIDGDLDIAWYPWLAVRTGSAQLGNPDGMAGKPLLQWQSARVGARLIPLIRGQLVISRVRLEGLRAHLRRTADGQTNWDDLLAKRDTTNRSTAPAPQIGGVEIRDGALDYVDEVSGLRLSLSQWQLEMDEWQSGRPVAGSTRFALGESASSRVSLAATMKTMQPLQAAGKLSIEGASLRKLLAELGIGGPRPRDEATLGAFAMTTDWAIEREAIAVKPLNIRLDQTKLQGELVRSGKSAPVWTFHLNGDRIELGRYTDVQDTDDEPFELPVAALKALRVQGVLTFDEAQLADARMKDVRLRVELEDGKLHEP